MDYDRTCSDFLIKSVIVGVCLNSKLILCPNPDTEGIRLIITIPEHELVLTFSIDGTGTLELGVIATGDE